MILGTPFRTFLDTPELYNNTYDTIIIGSGIGGLTLAGILSKAGQKVLVLEKHYTAGGFTHVFHRKGYEWDVGVHYIGEVHKEYSLLRRIFDYITDDKLEWAFMGETYDKIICGQDEYELVSGRDAFIERMSRYFPEAEDRKAIKVYTELVEEVAKSSKGHFAKKVLPSWLTPPLNMLMGRKWAKYAGQTTAQVLNQITSNRKLKGVLTGQYGDYGLPPGQSSFAMHALLVKHYLAGGNYPVGGSAQIAATIIPVIEKSGGRVLVRAGVEKILLEGNRAVGVLMENGQKLMAKNIVSNVGLFNTYQKLLPPSQAPKLPFASNAGIWPSVSHVCLYLGLPYSPEELNLPKHNLWIYPGYDHDLYFKQFLDEPQAEPPVSYVSFPAAKDPDWNRRHPGKSTVEVIGLAPFNWFGQWQDTRWHHRGDEYQAFKEKLAAPHLEALYRQLPQLKGKVEYMEISTPLSTRHFCYYEKGEIYGLNHSPSRFEREWCRPKTPIKNLFLTGQDVVTAGVGGAMMGGVLTATVQLRRNVLKLIMKETEHR